MIDYCFSKPLVKLFSKPFERQKHLVCSSKSFLWKKQTKDIVLVFICVSISIWRKKRMFKRTMSILCVTVNAVTMLLTGYVIQLIN